MSTNKVTQVKAKPTVWQEKVKTAPTIRYRGENKNCDEQFARDVITLYLTCKLGYAPIRRILGQKSEKKINSIIRQHGLCRKDPKKSDSSDAQLFCPSSKTISEIDSKLIRDIAKQYGTLESEYVSNMLRTGVWTDEKRTDSWKCPNCGTKYDEKESWDFCPKCGRRINPAKPRKLANIDEVKHNEID